MERVIHHFPVHDDCEISLVMVLDRGVPRIEWRRSRRQARGGVLHEEQFAIRLAWIPALVEGLLRAEEIFREMQLEIGAGALEAAAPGPGLPGGALAIGREPPAELQEAVLVASAESLPVDPAARVSGRFPRFVIRSPLIVAIQGKELTNARILTGDAVDISWGGLQAHLPAKLQVGTLLEILLGLGGKKALKLPARVVWDRALEGLGHSKSHGLKFLAADPRLRQVMEQYLQVLARGTRTEV